MNPTTPGQKQWRGEMVKLYFQPHEILMCVTRQSLTRNERIIGSIALQSKAAYLSSTLVPTMASPISKAPLNGSRPFLRIPEDGGSTRNLN